MLKSIAWWVYQWHITVDPLGGFRFWALINKAAMSVCIQVLWEHKFLFLWDKCPEAQLLGRYVVACLFFKEIAKLFSRECAILHFYQQCRNDSVFPCPHEDFHYYFFFLFVVNFVIHWNESASLLLFISAFLIDIVVIYHCILNSYFPTGANFVKHLFMCLFTMILFNEILPCLLLIF